MLKLRQIRIEKIVKSRSTKNPFYCHVGLLWKKEATRDWCAMKTESDFIVADVIFSLSAFFVFVLPWMAEYVIIRFIIEECTHKKCISGNVSRYCTTLQLCNESLVYQESFGILKCFARVTHAHATTSWIFAWTSDDLSRFSFFFTLLLDMVTWLIYLAHPSVLGPKRWLVARVVASSVHCDLFNLFKNRILRVFRSISAFN